MQLVLDLSVRANRITARIAEIDSKDAAQTYSVVLEMAGVAGFEPASAKVKVSCLTAWLHPNGN